VVYPHDHRRDSNAGLIIGIKGLRVNQHLEKLRVLQKEKQTNVG
jgi:hypothetical protein